jgi:hypothetical protein
MAAMRLRFSKSYERLPFDNSGTQGTVGFRTVPADFVHQRRAITISGDLIGFGVKERAGVVEKINPQIR